MLLLLLSGLALDGEVVEPQAPSGGHGFVITDHAPRQWWQRKPRAMPEEEAEQKVARIAGTIERIASRQGPASPVARKEIVQAIAPQLAEMPGFDWTVVYQAVLLGLHVRREQQEQEAAERAALDAHLLRIARDENDLLVLLMAA